LAEGGRSADLRLVELCAAAERIDADPATDHALIAPFRAA
jgi:hypothetical protein